MTEVPQKLATGSMGESVARVVFQRIGWAPPVKIDQDIGDDLMTFARAISDEVASTYDLSAPVFMQIKSSYTAYCEPSHSEDGKVGWWFSESDTDHFDHWLMFGLPYLLVLVDLSTEVAYWAHVTGPNIVSTGKGRKIFVPSDQRVVEASLDALNSIAVGHRSSSLEGSAWGGGFERLEPAARLRNALILPRLIAPHPNRPPAPISYEQAVAMILRNRINDLSAAADKGLCPKPDDWKANSKWGWRFVAALHTLIVAGDCSALDELSLSSTPKNLEFERDALNIVRACSLYAGGCTSQALETLKMPLSIKLADRGWINAQRAHMLFELNEPKAAAKAAQDALVDLKALEGDLSINAIRGGCAALLYSLADLGNGDLEGAVSAQDNAVSWWRSQDTSFALSKALNDRFNDWADDGSVTFRSVDPKDDLNAAALNAAFAANWSSWRHLSYLIAQLTLVNTREPESVQDALKLLVNTGQKRATKAAARRLWIGGPVEALCHIASSYATDSWSLRSEGAVMAIFQHGGDLLPPQLADNAISRVTDVLESDGPVRQHRACAELICSNFTKSAGHAMASIQIASSLNFSQLDEEMGKAVSDVALQREDSYRYELLQLLSPKVPAALDALQSLAADGEPSAMRALLASNLGAIELYQQLGKTAGLAVEQALAAARGTGGTARYSYGGADHLHDLTVAALRTQNIHLWEQVLEALQAGVLPASQVYRTVEAIAARYSTLPPDIRRCVDDIAASVSAVRDSSGSQDRFVGAVTALQLASGTATESDVLGSLLHFRRDDPATFTRLLRFWDSPHKPALLASLAADPVPEVRGTAVTGMIELAAHSPDTESEITDLILAALDLSEGCVMHQYAARALRGSQNRGPRQVRSTLLEHPSAVVRNLVEQSHPSAPTEASGT